jgi:hypothetical protein
MHLSITALYYVHKKPALVPILSQINQVHCDTGNVLHTIQMIRIWFLTKLISNIWIRFFLYFVNPYNPESNFFGAIFSYSDGRKNKILKFHRIRNVLHSYGRKTIKHTYIVKEENKEDSNFSLANYIFQSQDLFSWFFGYISTLFQLNK